MPTVISGDTGIDKVQDGAIGTADLANGAVTPGKLSGGQSGSAPVYGARAWCVFDGTLTGTNAPAAGGNVTNVTRNSAGNYTVTLGVGFADTNYATVVTVRRAGTDTTSVFALLLSTKTTTTFTIGVFNSAFGSVDGGQLQVAVYA